MKKPTASGSRSVPTPHAAARPAKPSTPAKPAAPSGPVDWSTVAAQSEALAASERSMEPAPGDLLDHPALGMLEVIAVDAQRLEVRDRERHLRKLARQLLQFRAGGERKGKRVLRVMVGSAAPPVPPPRARR